MFLCAFGFHRRKYVGTWFLAFWGPGVEKSTRAGYKREWFCTRLGCSMFGTAYERMFVAEADELNEQIEKEQKD